MDTIVIKERDRERDRDVLDWDDEPRSRGPVVRRYRYRPEDEYDDYDDYDSRYDERSGRDRGVSRDRIIIRDRSVGRRRNMHLDARDDAIEVTYDRDPSPLSWDDRDNRRTTRVVSRPRERDFEEVRVTERIDSPSTRRAVDEIRIERRESPARSVRGGRRGDLEEIRVIDHRGGPPEIVVTERRDSPARSVRRGDVEEIRVTQRLRDDSPSRHSVRSRRTVDETRITDRLVARDDSPGRHSVRSRRTEIDEVRSVRRDSPSRRSTYRDEEETVRISERRDSPSGRSVRSKRTEREVDEIRSSRHSSPSRHSHGGDFEEVHITERKREDGEEVERDIRITERRDARSRKSSSSGSPPPRSVKSSKTVRREVRRESDDDDVPYSIDRYTRSADYVIPTGRERVVERERIVVEEDPPVPAFLVEQPPREVVIRDREEFVEDDRQLVLRPDRNDDIYYERRVQKVERPRHRHHRHRSRRRHSDDEVEVHRKVTVYRDESPARSKSRHRRRLLEGAIGGVVAGEVLRRNRIKSGQDPGSRLGTAAGYGALGAIGGEAISRFQDWNDDRRDDPRDDRRRGRDRDYDYDDDDDDGRYGRDRSRSRGNRKRSLSRSQLLLGAAAIAAAGATAYALNRRSSMKAKSTNDLTEENLRLGRPRTREGSYVEEDGTVTERQSRSRRGSLAAKAGLAGAALAGIAGSVGKKSRSQSRVRQALPIVATGLGTAAAAKLYERHQAKRDAQGTRRGSRSRSRSRSQSAPPLSRDPEVGAESAALVQYGDAPIYPGEEQHVGRRSRSGSRGRHYRSRSADSPDGRHHSRSRSRSRVGALAGAAAAGGIAALAASEASKLRENRRAERARRRAARSGAETVGVPYTATGQFADPEDHYYPTSNDFAPPPPADQYGHGPDGYGPPGNDGYGPPPGPGHDSYGPPPGPGHDGYGPPPGPGHDGYGPPPGPGHDGYGPPPGPGQDGYGPPPGPGYPPTPGPIHDAVYGPPQDAGYGPPPGQGYQPGYNPAQQPTPGPGGYIPPQGQMPPGEFAHRSYNPADHGPTTGPTLPPETPPHEQPPIPDSYHHEEDHHRDRGPPDHPENVSSEPVSEPFSAATGAAPFIQPGTSQYAGPSQNIQDFQSGTILTPETGGLNPDHPLNQSHSDGNVTPRGPPSPMIETITTPLPDGHEGESSTNSKSVQFADNSQQSHSDSELDRPPFLSRRQPTGFASSADRDGQRRRRSGKRTDSPASDHSSETIELPPRFDGSGRHMNTDDRHDSVGDAVEAFLTGRTRAGASFNRAVDGWLGLNNNARGGRGRDRAGARRLDDRYD